VAKHRFTIEGITCAACARKAESALNAVPTVDARVSYAEGVAIVTAGESISVERLDGAVREHGYRLIARAEQVDAVDRASAGGGSRPHIAIIGSGSGAFAAAIRAMEEGARVTLVERASLGGTCVNVGCVPSKIMLRAGEIAHYQSNHPFAGLPSAGGRVDRAVLTEQVRARVDEMRHDKYERILADHEAIERISGHARLSGPETIEVERSDGDPSTVAADRILIATGSSPAAPPIPGLEATPWWSSNEALFTEETPAHLVVLGASFVACELAQAFRRLGSEVTVVARSRLLGYEAPEIGDALASAFEAEGIRIVRETEAQRVAHDGTRFRVELPHEHLSPDRLLVATGRRANTGDLGLEHAGVVTKGDGAITVDEALRTSADGIYAVGDCTTLPRLVYVAAAAGTRAAINMTGGAASLDLSLVPSVVFTDPQVAAVGYDEEKA